MFTGSTASSSTSSTASSTPSAPSSSTAASTTPATTPASSSFSFGAAGSTFGAATSSTRGSTASTTATSSSSSSPFGGSTAPTAAAATPSPTVGSLFGGRPMKQTPNAFGGSTGGFGQPVATTAATSGGFGQPVAAATTTSGSGLFGTTTTSGGFGQPVAAPASTAGSGFGFGATSGGFGQPVAAGSTTSGGGLFGATTTSGGFGQPVAAPASTAGSGFGFGAAATSGGFGQPVAAATTTSGGFSFGAATTTSGGFGQPSTPGGFGTSSTAPAFGAPASAGVFRPPPPSPCGGASFLGSPAGHFSSFAPTPTVNVSRLFDRRDLFPDVILQYQGQNIYAHKAILALGSPKLQKMFDDEHSTSPPMMQENKPVYLLDDDIKGLQFTDVSRVIKVPSMQPSYPLFYLNLTGFCYTGCFDADLPLAAIINDRLIHIALVAEEFKMTTLSSTCQMLCLYKVKAETSLEPILEALETAHQNGLVELKKGIMTHLASSYLGGTVEEFMRLDKDLLAELLLHVTGMLHPGPAPCAFDFGSDY